MSFQPTLATGFIHLSSPVLRSHCAACVKERIVLTRLRAGLSTRSLELGDVTTLKLSSVYLRLSYTLPILLIPLFIVVADYPGLCV